MKTTPTLIFLCFSVLSTFSLFGQYTVKKDLQEEWLSYGEGGYKPYERSSSSVVYLNLKNPSISGEYLNIKSILPFTLFINNQLAGRSSFMMLKIDSLADVYATNNLVVAIHQDDISKKGTKTLLCSRVQSADKSAFGMEKRQSTYFRDFAIIGFLFLTVMVIVIVRLNPKLAADYFSFPRIVSLREADESQLYTRIGNSTNVLFYAYCSLLLGYYLIVIFHFVPEVYTVSLSFVADGFGGLMLQWIKLSGVLLFLCFLKIILVYGVSYLFGISQVAGIHFFNWVRLLVVIFGSLTIGLFLYVLWHGYNQETHAMMLRLVAWIVGAWIVLIFLKLSSKANASMFHLFSYICATELIPFLFIIKVLYN